MQRGILDTWESDWYGSSDRNVPIGRLRLLHAHDKTIQETLRTICAELDKLSPLHILQRDVSNPKVGERMKWAAGKRNLAEESLQRVGNLLQHLCMTLSLQSPLPEAKTMVVLAQAEQSGTLLQIPSEVNVSLPPLIRQTLELGRLKRTFDEDLKKRIAEFKTKIPGEPLDNVPQPPTLIVEEGTAGTRSWSKANSQILVEWKDYGGGKVVEGQRAIDLRGLNDNLARMLHAVSKPAELLTLPCRGYFDDIQAKKYGFVFQFPADEGETAISLNKLLDNPPAERLPTLEQRLQMAYSLSLSLAILFGIEWLHKSIRSHNILFGIRGDTVCWSSPYLCGFVYARPDRPDVPSEKVDQGERFNLYRHPKAQDEPRE